MVSSAEAMEKMAELATEKKEVERSNYALQKEGKKLLRKLEKLEKKYADSEQRSQKLESALQTIAKENNSELAATALAAAQRRCSSAKVGL